MSNYIERALRFRRTHGTDKLLREAWIRVGRRLGFGAPAPSSLAADTNELVVRELPQCSPLLVYPAPGGESGRVNLVVDSINPGSLFGGMGTALILAALIAEARGSRLRVVTRNERAQPSSVASVLGPNGIVLTREPEFVHASFLSDRRQLDVGTGELFITTSWWITASAMASLPPESILYLLQEDERMFYPYDDDHLQCAQVLASEGIGFAVNSRLLYDHLVSSGLDNVRDRGQWFEPAFPPSVFHPAPAGAPAGRKRRLLFYARPRNARNLFRFGLRIIETALARGILNPDEWELVFVGRAIPRQLRLGDARIAPTIVENLPWAAYAELVRGVDLGLCLMYTPHPSYPPLDLAASGAVAVTNRHGNKHDLQAYSANIVCGEPTLEGMLQALEEGMRLARDTERRERNFRANGLSTDWSAALAGIVGRYAPARRNA